MGERGVVPSSGGVTMFLLKNQMKMKKMGGPESDGAVTKLPMGIMDMVAVGAVGACLTTMALTSGHIVDLACVFTTAFAPYAAYQKRSLISLGTLRGQINALREMVNDLHGENEKLTENVDRLETNVSQLEEVEKNLSKLADTSNVNRLVDVVQKHKKVTEKIKENLKSRVIQDVLTTVVRSDRNQDFYIGPREMNILIMRLNMMEGVEFREDKFREVLGEDKTHHMLGDIMSVLRNLLESDGKDDSVFELKPDDLNQPLLDEGDDREEEEEDA